MKLELYTAAEAKLYYEANTFQEVLSILNNTVFILVTEETAMELNKLFVNSRSYIDGAVKTSQPEMLYAGWNDPNADRAYDYVIAQRDREEGYVSFSIYNRDEDNSIMYIRLLEKIAGAMMAKEEA